MTNLLTFTFVVILLAAGGLAEFNALGSETAGVCRLTSKAALSRSNERPYGSSFSMDVNSPEECQDRAVAYADSFPDFIIWLPKEPKKKKTVSVQAFHFVKWEFYEGGGIFWSDYSGKVTKFTPQNLDLGEDVRLAPDGYLLFGTDFKSRAYDPSYDGFRSE